MVQVRVLSEALQRKGEDPQLLLSAEGLDDESLAHQLLLEEDSDGGAQEEEPEPSAAAELAPGEPRCSSIDEPSPTPKERTAGGAGDEAKRAPPPPPPVRKPPPPAAVTTPGLVPTEGTDVAPVRFYAGHTELSPMLQGSRLATPATTSAAAVAMRAATGVVSSPPAPQTPSPQLQGRGAARLVSEVEEEEQGEEAEEEGSGGKGRSRNRQRNRKKREKAAAAAVGEAVVVEVSVPRCWGSLRNGTGPWNAHMNRTGGVCASGGAGGRNTRAQDQRAAEHGHLAHERIAGDQGICGAIHPHLRLCHQE